MKKTFSNFISAVLRNHMSNCHFIRTELAKLYGKFKSLMEKNPNSSTRKY